MVNNPKILEDVPRNPNDYKNYLSNDFIKQIEKNINTKYDTNYGFFGFARPTIVKRAIPQEENDPRIRNLLKETISPSAAPAKAPTQAAPAKAPSPAASAKAPTPASSAKAPTSSASASSPDLSASLERALLSSDKKPISAAAEESKEPSLSIPLNEDGQENQAKLAESATTDYGSIEMYDKRIKSFANKKIPKIPDNINSSLNKVYNTLSYKSDDSLKDIIKIKNELRDYVKSQGYSYNQAMELVPGFKASRAVCSSRIIPVKSPALSLTIFLRLIPIPANCSCATFVGLISDASADFKALAPSDALIPPSFIAVI
jgi:hypothetical protein